MKFWDSSAIVPLLLAEPDSAAVAALLADDSRQLVWAGSGVEVASAIWRRWRAGELTDDVRDSALRSLTTFESSWTTVVDAPAVFHRARRVLATHSLRAADSCQLAAALHASRERPGTLAFVCLDERLIDAAHREGFEVQPT
jgi:predicted nucleic acid-binding protein